MTKKIIDFTVLIPVYNTKCSELIEAVLSVLSCNQTIDQDYSVVIVDDGSDLKETLIGLDILKLAGVTVYHKPENGGTSSALNLGHEMIKTEWIAIMGSSDISLPDRFRRQVEHLQNNPGLDVLGTNLHSFYENDPDRVPIYTSSHAYETTLGQRSEGWLTNHGTVMYKNQSVKDVGGYLLPGRCQDVDLWKRMALAGKKIRTLGPVMYLWRKLNV